MEWLLKFIDIISSLFKKEVVVKPVKEPKKEEVPMRQFRIVIDPGHGGKDGGATTEKSKEQELNLIYKTVQIRKLIVINKLLVRSGVCPHAYRYFADW